MRSVARVVLAGLAVAGCLLACGEGPEPATEGTSAGGLSPVAAMAAAGDGYARAVTPRRFTFPRDHGPHDDFQLEWWYFVGHLDGAGGRRFGFQLTFFRQAASPEERARPSAWATRQLYLAHFALTDVDGDRFHAFERSARGAAGLAGARAAPFRVWLEDWSAASVEGADGFLPLRLRASGGGSNGDGGDVAIELVAQRGKELVLQGEDGLSRKGPEPGQASYYYAYTRLPLAGTVKLAGRSYAVTGEGWLDREWSTSVLGAGQVGWDWLALQLDDGRDLMLFHLRRADGTVEPLSHGALVEADGTKRHLTLAETRLEVLDRWTSPGGTVYPAAWRVAVPSAGLELRLRPLVADQELDVAFRYWEGAVELEGTSAGREVAGRGYVELVGYGGED